MGNLAVLFSARHAGHFGLLFGIPAVVLTLVGVSDRRRHKQRSGTRDRQLSSAPEHPAAREHAFTAPFALAALSAGAGVAHAAVINEHLREFWLFGLFFIGAAAAQITWAGLILRKANRRLIKAGAFGNAFVVLLWIASRTTGLPLGPDRWTPERVGSIGVIATGMELALVGVCLVLYRQRWGGKSAITPAGGSEDRVRRVLDSSVSLPTGAFVRRMNNSQRLPADHFQVSDGGQR